MIDLIDEERAAPLHAIVSQQRSAMCELGVVDAGLLLIAAAAADDGELPYVLTDDRRLGQVSARLDGVRVITPTEMWSEVEA